MTDNEIIKALECCKGADTDCWECELFDSCKFTVREIMQNALDFINRQKAEIERYKIALRNSEQSYRYLMNGLIKGTQGLRGDNIVKEMVGENNEN